MSQNEKVLLGICIIIFVLAVLAQHRFRASTTAFGTAFWMNEKMMLAAGLLGNVGLILGRTMTGKLIRIKNYCHVLLVGATGSGKSLLIIPILFSYFRGSVVCVDIKGDLNKTCGRRRKARGQRVITLAPFNNGSDRLNPLDCIPNDHLLIDSARALAESLVVRSGSEPDAHWNDKSVQIITAILVLILMRFEGEERSLNSLQEIASDVGMLLVAAEKLQETGDLPRRLGSQIKALFDKDGLPTKEGSSVLSTVARHLSFLDSELVARCVSSSTFDPHVLLKPGTTLFLQIPPDQLEAQKGLFRCWMSTLVRVIAAAGDERKAETLLIVDEASALGSLTALEEALVRGRSSGLRLLLAYQSDSQIQNAFKDKPTLIYDNCTSQLYLGASSIESAERISKSLGEWTQVVEGYSDNASRSWNEGGYSSGQGQSVSKANAVNYSVSGRALLKPDEILRLSDNLLICLLRGTAPLLVKRIKWFKDRDFKHLSGRSPQKTLGWLVVLVIAALFAWALRS